MARRLSEKLLDGGYEHVDGSTDQLHVMSKARFFASLNQGKPPTVSLSLRAQPEFTRLSLLYERLLDVCSIGRFAPADTLHPAVKEQCAKFKLPAELLHRASGLVLKLVPRPVQHSSETDFACYMSHALVSQRHWQQIMGPIQCQIEGPELAVHNVNFYDCRKYVQRIGLELPERWRLKEAIDLANPSRTSGAAKEALASDSNRVDRLGLIQMTGALAHWCKDEPDDDGRCEVFGLSHRDRHDAEPDQLRLATTRAWIGIRPVLTIPLTY